MGMVMIEPGAYDLWPRHLDEQFSLAVVLLNNSCPLEINAHKHVAVDNQCHHHTTCIARNLGLMDLADKHPMRYQLLELLYVR